MPYLSFCVLFILFNMMISISIYFPPYCLILFLWFYETSFVYVPHFYDGQIYILTSSVLRLLSHDIHETLHDFIHGFFLTLEAFLSILCTGIPFHRVVSTLFIAVSWGQVYSPYGAIYFLLFSLEAWLFNICILFYFSGRIS